MRRSTTLASPTLEESRHVAAMLGEIFREDEAGAGSAANAASGADTVPPAAHPSGMDSRHVEFLRLMCAEPAWASTEWAAVARRLNLMPAGAIDTINAAALEAFDEPIFEDDGELMVDIERGRELLTWQ